MRKIFKKAFSVAMVTSIFAGNMAMPIASYAASTNVSQGYYTLKNSFSNKNLNVSGSGNGANINVYKENGQKNQVYKISKTSSSYTLTPYHTSTGKLVNVQGNSAYNNANVMLYSKSGNGHSTQRWIFEKVSGGYILKSASNSKYVLTCTGSGNNSNVNVQTYKKGNKKQIWKLNKVFVSESNKGNSALSTNNTQNKTVEQIKAQITSTYKKCKQLTGRSDFKKQCVRYVYSQLQVLGIYQTPDKVWYANQWYSNLTNNGVTKTGYTQKKYPGKNCLSKIVSANNNKNVYNIVVTFPNSYVDGKNNGYGGAGHVLFIHAIIDGKVYYSDNYRYAGKPEGSVIVKSVSEFTNYFSYHYGGPTGAVHFVK